MPPERERASDPLAEDAHRASLEKAVARVLQRARLFADAAEPLLILSLDGEIVDCNDEALRLYGRAREALVGRALEALVTEEGRVAAREHLARCRGGEDVLDVEAVHLGEGERPVPVLVSFSRITGAQDRPVGIGLIARDLHTLRGIVTSWRSTLRVVERAEEEERRALARDLHDSLGQVLALARMKAAALCDDPGTDLRTRLREVEYLVNEAHERSRTLVFRLSPPVLDELGIGAAAEWLAEDMGARYGLRVRVRDDGAPKPLGRDARGAVYRSLRELLINVARHARTDEAEVTLAREDDALVVVVEDRGVGMDLHTVRAGFGLSSVRERMESLGGRFELASRPDDGARARLVVPLAQAQPPAANRRVTPPPR